MKGCPLCGEGHLPDIKVPGIVWDEYRLTYNLNYVASFTKVEARFLDYCLRIWPRVGTYERCIYATWPYEEPDEASNSLRVHANKIRKKIHPAGLTLLAANHVGYRFFLPQEVAYLKIDLTNLNRCGFCIPSDLFELSEGQCKQAHDQKDKHCFPAINHQASAPLR